MRQQEEMVPIEQLTEEERTDALDELDEWDFDEARDAITRTFTFADFSEAFAFMTARRPARGKGGPSPRMVERVEPGRDLADHPRRGRPVAA